jgi:hypothetical protein
MLKNSTTCYSSVAHNHVHRIIIPLLALLVALPVMAFLSEVPILTTYITADVFYVYLLILDVGDLYKLWLFHLFIACYITFALECASCVLDTPSFASAFSLASQEANRFSIDMFSLLCFRVMEKSLQVRGNLAMMHPTINALDKIHLSC